MFNVWTKRFDLVMSEKDTQVKRRQLSRLEIALSQAIRNATKFAEPASELQELMTLINKELEK